MDALTAAAFESRASEAEARLAVLEEKLLAGAAGVGNAGVGSVKDLAVLKEVILKARAEAVKMQGERDMVVNENMKLKYQIKHLKRTVQEADEKLQAKI